MKNDYRTLSHPTCAIVWLALAAYTPFVAGQTVAPEFASSYNIRAIDKAGDVPTSYGGIAFKAGDPDTLLIGGHADAAEAKIYQIKVNRDAQGHITGFDETASFFADAPALPPVGSEFINGGIDGGLDYGPNEVLFYLTYPEGVIGQIKPGSTVPDKRIRLGDLGVEGGGGALLFVPPGYPGAGRLKFTCYTLSQWFDAAIQPDGSGTFDVVRSSTVVTVGAGPEGIFFVKGGSPQFAKDSVLLANYGIGQILAYEIDANGDPLPETVRLFIRDLSGATGAARDPVTGDFVFSSYSETRVFVVGGFSAGSVSVQLKTPENGARFTAPATFQLSAEAQQGSSLINRVDYYQGQQLVGSANLAPYGFLVNNLPAGEYDFTAVAIGQGGISATSAVAHVTVAHDGPRITLRYPTNDSTVLACSDMLLSAIVVPGSGNITSVEFSEDNQLLGTALGAPFTFKALHLAEGTHIYSVKVTDTNGLSAMAIATNVVVMPLSLDTLTINYHAPTELLVCFKGLTGANYVWESTATLPGLNGGQPVWTPFFTNPAPAGICHMTNSVDKQINTLFFRTRRAP